MDKKRRLRFILKWVLFFGVVYKTIIFIYCLEGPDIEVTLANRNMTDKARCSRRLVTIRRTYGTAEG